MNQDDDEEELFRIVLQTSLMTATTQQLEKEQLNAAILASQEEQERVRRKKEEEERSLAVSGDVRSYYSDSILISDSKFVNHVLSMVESRADKLRKSLCELLELERKSVKWFREPAKCYARKLTRDLDKKTGSSRMKRKNVFDILRNEIESLNEIMFSMPDVPGGEPKAFASAYDDPLNRGNEKEDDDVIDISSSPVPTKKKKKKKREDDDDDDDIDTSSTRNKKKRRIVVKKKNSIVIANQAIWQFHGGNGSNDWIDMDSQSVETLETAISQNMSETTLIPMGCHTSYKVLGLNESNDPIMYQTNQRTGFKRAIRRHVLVTVPEYAKPGDTFKVRYKSKLLLMQCPVSVSPGSVLRFSLGSITTTKKKK